MAPPLATWLPCRLAGKGGGVVCDYQIPAAQQGDEIGTEDPAHAPVSVDRKELRLRRALDGPTFRDH